MAAMAGFCLSDVTSWAAFVCLMNRPAHPANLAFVRILYGILMLFDTVMDRGMAVADVRWDENTCHFPLIPGLTPLPPQWMMMLYLLMVIGLVGMILGLGYRSSSLMFILPYIYIWLLDKSKWSNHGAFFMWLGIDLALSDANRYWSLDGIIWPKMRNADVPLWNYYILRLQVFILYFISGLKKFHPDWLGGFSQNLGYKRAVAPLRYLMSATSINQQIHLAGVFLDIFLGFFLFFDKTRPVALLMGVVFHVMNRFLFYGLYMFPYISIATLFIFCSFDWPVTLMNKVIEFFGTKRTNNGQCYPNGRTVSEQHSYPDGDVVNDVQLQPSDNCLYERSHIQATRHMNGETKHARTTPRLRHTAAAIFVLCFTAQQFFTPYSHFITKGWSGWREGVAGYSWDMMVYNSNISVVQIKYVQKHTGLVGYVNINAFILASRRRWHTYGDQAKVFGNIVADRLELHHNITNVSIYFDAWKTLGRRFNQRQLHPNIDVLTAPWNVLEPTSWITPLLTDLEHWRPELKRRRAEVRRMTNFTRIKFFADFPDTPPIRHYVRSDIDQVNITVLEGQLTIQLTNENVTLDAGQTLHNIPPREYHVVRVTSEKPAAFYYMYVDVREERLQKQATELSLELQRRRGVTDESMLELDDFMPDPRDAPGISKLKQEIYTRRGETIWEHVRVSVWQSGQDWYRSYVGVMAAIRSIWSGDKMAAIMADTWNYVTTPLPPLLMEEHEAHQLV